MLKKISKINYRIKIVNKISLSFINLYSFIKHSVFVFSTANIKIPKIISDFIIFHENKSSSVTSDKFWFSEENHDSEYLFATLLPDKNFPLFWYLQILYNL